MQFFVEKNGILTARLGGETLRIEPWGKIPSVCGQRDFQIYRSGLGAYGKRHRKNVRQSLRSARRITGLVTAPSIKDRVHH